MNLEIFTQSMKLIDEANRQDPNLEKDRAGSDAPKELLYSQRMSSSLTAFNPKASVHLQLACRAQHIERWKSPRSDYPAGRNGYNKWRAELRLFHAKRAGECMLEAHAEQEDIDRVKFLVQKRHMKLDAESQCLEDVVCLTFLQYYLEGFAKKHEELKLIDIIQKTWKKMSDEGQQAALKLPLAENMLSLIVKALGI
ncbi:MAG: DUF4202 domain-containing protein [Gammaproteobacteria bacterium]|nr:DUF4202 domain-containing protein [Gammaproteobacteria bacterium]MDH3465645.1 DUF4202 domain-containing protein [Gammaproteobacteria bacterium]